MIFVIFVFSKHHVEAVIKFLESNIPFMTNKLTEIIEKQKKVLHSPELIQVFISFYIVFYVLG